MNILTLTAVLYWHLMHWSGTAAIRCVGGVLIVIRRRSLYSLGVPIAWQVSRRAGAKSRHTCWRRRRRASRTSHGATRPPLRRRCRCARSAPRPSWRARVRASLRGCALPCPRPSRLGWRRVTAQSRPSWRGSAARLLRSPPVYPVRIFFTSLEDKPSYNKTSSTYEKLVQSMVGFLKVWQQLHSCALAGR